MGYVKVVRVFPFVVSVRVMRPVLAMSPNTNSYFFRLSQYVIVTYISVTTKMGDPFETPGRKTAGGPRCAGSFAFSF